MKTYKEGIERSHRFCNFKQGIKENEQGNAMMKQDDSAKKNNPLFLFLENSTMGTLHWGKCLGWGIFGWKPRFSKPAILKFCLQKFQRLVLGLID